MTKKLLTLRIVGRNARVHARLMEDFVRRHRQKLRLAKREERRKLRVEEWEAMKKRMAEEGISFWGGHFARITGGHIELEPKDYS